MRRHVVLLTYGEPPRPEFLAQLRYSWRILVGLTRTVAAIPPLLLPLIALSRARSRVASWRSERFVSPLEPITRDQAAALAARLAAWAPEHDWQVHVAYEFRDPLLLDCLRGLPAGEPVDVVPMYVADSAFTHQLARDTLAAGLARNGGAPRAVQVLPPIPIDLLAEVSANHVRRELAARGIVPSADWGLVLAAHGTLVDPPRPYETGRIATEELGKAIATRLAPDFGAIRIGWLNHAFGGRWTEPPADQALHQVAEHGHRRVVYFPFGFLADNAESLLEGRQALRTRPGLEAVHLPCLNADEDLISALAEQIGGAGAGLGNGVGARAAVANGSARHRRLDQLQPGEHAIVRRVDGDPGNVRRLMELGLVPGTPVEVVRRAPFGDPMEVRVREIHLSVRRSETARIHVEHS